MAMTAIDDTAPAPRELAAVDAEVAPVRKTGFPPPPLAFHAQSPGGRGHRGIDAAGAGGGAGAVDRALSRRTLRTRSISKRCCHRPRSSTRWGPTRSVGMSSTRVMFGARWSLAMAAIVLAIAVAIGVPLGLCAGYYGGALEQVLMRITDGFSAVPALVLALAITVLLGPSLLNAMVAIGLVWWRSFARIAHGQTLSKKQENYVTVAKSLGASDFHIMFREILPNISSPLFVSISLNCRLRGPDRHGRWSFLGAGARPPTPEWGQMVASSRNYLPDAWWASLFPGIAIFITVVSFNLIGDGLRDYFSED